MQLFLKILCVKQGICLVEVGGFLKLWGSLKILLFISIFEFPKPSDSTQQIHSLTQKILKIMD